MVALDALLEIIDPMEILWAIINFVILLVILKLLFWKPIMKLLEERREEVQANLAEAEAARREARQMQEEYETRLQTARREAQDILRKAQQQAESTADEIVNRARNEAEAQRRQAQEQIEEQKQAAIQELRQEVAELAVMAAGQILRRKMNDADHLRLAEEFVAEIEEVGELN